MPLSNKRNRLLFYFWAFFVANAVVAELMSVKLFDAGKWLGWDEHTYVIALGLLPWPIVFIATDVLNEFYGQAVVRRMSLVTSVVLLYVYGIIAMVDSIPAFDLAGVTDEQFTTVYKQSGFLIGGSVVAFLFSQFLDIALFGLFRKWTKGRFIWLRATGSTVISQLFDSIIVIGIGFYIPGIVNFDQYFWMVVTGYSIKLILSVAITPLIYLAHFMVRGYLNKEAEHESVD